MQKLKLMFAIALGLALAGCTVGPKYRRPQTDVPPAYRGQVPELSNAQVPPATLGDANWKSVFQDEQLQSLITTALERNYDVRIAAERVIAAQAQLGITRADQMPTIGVGAGASTIRQPQSKLSPAYQVEAGQVSANASWELDFWGKYRRATEAARANLAATEWGRRAITNTIISGIASSYLQLRELDAELEITQNSLTSRQESLRLTKMLADGGATSMADVRQAEQLVYTASSAIPVLQQRIEQQENYISTLLGSNPGPIARGKSLADQPRLAAIPAGLPSELLERRPEIRQAEEQLIAANAQIGVAKASLFPSISLTGTAGYQSSALTSLFSSSAGMWNAGASVLQPVFAGGRLRNNVRLTESQQRQALLAYQQALQNGFREVSDALIAYQKTAEAHQEQQKLVDAAQDGARLARVRYEAGAAAYLEVLTNETNLYSAQLSMTQSRLNEMLALVQVYNSLGGGWK